MKYKHNHRYRTPLLGGHAKHPRSLRKDVHVGSEVERNGDAEPRDGPTARHCLRTSYDTGGVPGLGQAAI